MAIIELGEITGTDPAPPAAPVNRAKILRMAEVVTVSEDDRLTFLRYADGSIIRSQALSRRATEVAFAGGYVLGVDRSDQPPFTTSTTVYRWDDLTPLWTTDTEDGLMGCRPLLCGFDNKGLVAHDPSTGLVRWRTDAGRLDLTTGKTTLLGALNPGICWDLGGYLACPDQGQLVVTDVG